VCGFRVAAYQKGIRGAVKLSPETKDLALLEMV
jgi:hypothetical protein